MRDQMIDAARGYAELAMGKALGVVDIDAIALGGSLSSNSVIDRSSDIDLFVYVAGPQLTQDDMATVFGAKPGEVRTRTFLREWRTEIAGFDSNVKLFAADYLVGWATRQPQLDNHYLEEVESYDKFLIMASAEGSKVTAAISDLHSRKPGIVAELADVALERYGKSVFWAVYQWIERGDAEAASFACHDAINSLLCLAHLLGGRLPSSLKWRGSCRPFEQAYEGIRELLSEYLTGEGDVARRLQLLRAMEEVLRSKVRERSSSPWRLHVEEWWWSKLDG